MLRSPFGDSLPWHSKQYSWNICVGEAAGDDEEDGGWPGTIATRGVAGADDCADRRAGDAGWADMTAMNASARSRAAENPSRFIGLPSQVILAGSGSGLQASGFRAART